MPRPWTDERRAAARERMLRVRPWLKSTGPRTAAGKARCIRNALKHGRYSQAAKDIARTLRDAARYVRQLRIWMRIQDELLHRVIAAVQRPDGTWQFYFTREPEKWPAI